MTTRPARSEAAEYYFTYIDQVPAGDICQVLEDQLPEAVSFFRGITDERSLHRYAADKWSIREVVNHLSDGERLFTFRAFWFARGFDSPLPSFDQHVAVSRSQANQRSWSSLIDEFATVRMATLSFFQTVPAEAWAARGVASDNPFTVRALAFIAAGHLAHHTKLLRTNYLGV